MDFEFSKHALDQMKLRMISKEVVEKILMNSDQIRDEDGYRVYQSITENGKYLIRIFVKDKIKSKLVITVYKTSKIKKYYEGKI